MTDKKNNEPLTWGFVQAGPDVETIMGSAYPGFGSADGILPDRSSKHRLFLPLRVTFNEDKTPKKLLY